MGRLDIMWLKMKVDMVLAKGETSEAGKWSNTDLKVMIHWFKWDGGKAVPNNKDDILLCYRETCTRVVTAVTYREDDMTSVNVDVAAVVDIATAAAAVAVAVGIGDSFPTADVGGIGVLWSLSTVAATQPVAIAAADKARSPPIAATRTTDDDARSPPAAATRTTDAARPTSTHEKTTFATAAYGTPDDAHATAVATPMPPDAAFQSITMEVMIGNWPHFAR
jgi:hypothetical protein